MPARVAPIPGLEHLPYAEASLDRVDIDVWAEASAAARALGKTGLEIWTTTRTPEVASFLEDHGFEEVRRYVVSELDVANAEEPGEPAHEVVSYAERPGLADTLFAIARVAYADQPGRAETVIDEAWYEWGLGAHDPEAVLVAVDGERVLGYGYLQLANGVWTHGFTAVDRAHRGCGVAGAIKRAQIGWAKRRGVSVLRTANEVRLESMLALNARFGYVPLFEEIVLRGPLAPPPGR